MIVSRIVNSFTYNFSAYNEFPLIEIKLYFFWENGHLPASQINPVSSYGSAFSGLGNDKRNRSGQPRSLINFLAKYPVAVKIILDISLPWRMKT